MPDVRIGYMLIPSIVAKELKIATKIIKLKIKSLVDIELDRSKIQ